MDFLFLKGLHRKMPDIILLSIYRGRDMTTTRPQQLAARNESISQQNGNLEPSNMEVAPAESVGDSHSQAAIGPRFKQQSLEPSNVHWQGKAEFQVVPGKNSSAERRDILTGGERSINNFSASRMNSILTTGNGMGWDVPAVTSGNVWKTAGFPGWMSGRDEGSQGAAGKELQQNVAPMKNMEHRFGVNVYSNAVNTNATTEVTSGTNAKEIYSKNAGGTQLPSAELAAVTPLKILQNAAEKATQDVELDMLNLQQRCMQPQSCIQKTPDTIPNWVRQICCEKGGPTELCSTKPDDAIFSHQVWIK